MTRASTLSQKIGQAKSLKTRIFFIIGTIVLITLVYFILRKLYSVGSSGDFVAKRIPKSYSRPEVLVPEDRDVFQGFQTSFLPSDEVVIARRPETDPVSLIFNNELEEYTPKRVKRKSHHFPKNAGTIPKYRRDIDDDDDEGEKETEECTSSSNEDYEEESNIQSVVHPEMYVDRGPLDDVEQVRRQPELEEGEMVSSAHIFKPLRCYSGIHAFWKGQGDKQTIRETQANIMKQYMDEGADPCHDFYQYACGNWAAVNPIPADKAGYDTFEILRESLDSVLKDLLEFKEHEQISSMYPGVKLDLPDNILNLINCPVCSCNTRDVLDVVMTNSKESLNYYSGKLRHNDAFNTMNRNKRYPNIVLKRKFTKRNNRANYKFNYNSLNTYNAIKVDKVDHVKGKRKKIDEGKHQHRKKISFYKKKRRKRSIDLANNNEKVNKQDGLAVGDATLKARYLFKSCMNHDILSERGFQPLLDLLDVFGGWPILDTNWKSDGFDWLELMAKLRLFNNDILISEWVGPDIRNSDEYVIQFDQTSLGLPTRDYFIQESNKMYLDAYKEYLIKIAFILGGSPNHIEQSADKLIDFEIQLAKITSAPEDRRNVSELYRRMTLSKLEELVPEIDWRKYLCIVMNKTVQSNEPVVLFALTYVQHLVQWIHRTDPNTLSNYLLWRFVRHRVNNLDDRFSSAKQEFYNILFGREQSPPRWKNCITQVNSNMGMALGSMFVRKYFDEMSKNDTLTMTREIQQSFRDLLRMTSWIDDETKKLAAHKVDTMMLRIGYPDYILNKDELDDRYKDVVIHPEKYFENILNILHHLTKTEQSRVGQPVNKTLWNTAPAVVNAYYSRNKNQIMFPAGILQPPFYHRHFPRSLNFGGIGVVIGHEITHGFDDKGRLFDCEGNLHRWWSDSAVRAFHKHAQCLIDQYGEYIVPEVNIRLDGVNTQGENIADNGGVKQAFHAYLRWLEHHDASDELMPGLNHTHKQLFFLNFAQVWCGAMRPEAMRNKLKTTVHSPGRFRVVGTLSNSEDFAREWNCPPGSSMNPVNKCSVW
ncbi:neprilysin-4-like [Aricia agestis]|uniref:neprilysin-4-like n=1 Tax=Aricia agestis TaxID=91739 RepID=UPI001C201FF7|nr:neprilysin-4-like [Aricia agestis]